MQTARCLVADAKRYYYRCCDCLGVAATAERMPAAECGACGGKLEEMGHVHQDRLVKTELRVPCDARCTNAVGPSCDCQCGGANHGSGLLVEVVTEVGRVPRLMIDPAAGARAAEYRSLLDRVERAWQGKYNAVTMAKREGRYLDRGEYGLYMDGCRWRERIHEVKAMRSHKGRNGALASLAVKLGAAEIFDANTVLAVRRDAREDAGRLSAAEVSLAWKSARVQRMPSFEDSPLFGGDRQAGLFGD